MARKKLDMSDHPEVTAKIERTPRAWRKAFRLAISGKSRTAALKVFCGECVGWIRKEVRFCTSPGCPLYPYRPFQTEQEAVDEETEVTVDDEAETEVTVDEEG